MKTKIYNPTIKKMLAKKACQSQCTYRISAVAFDEKGDILGYASNSHSDWDVLKKGDGVGRPGTGKHAERILISRYGQNIKSILICRVGHSGELRYIDPCPSCKKVADKYGIKIHSISDYIM